MISYAENEVFSDQELRYWEQATRIIAKIEDEVPLLRCHELCRVVGELLGLPVCDGYYGMVDHSWLWLGDAPHIFGPLPNILDVYCPGRLPQVQLIHSSNSLPFEYRRHAPRTDIRQDVVTRLVAHVFRTEV